MQSFPLLVEEILVDGPASDGLNNLVREAARDDFCMAETDCEGMGLAAVDLVGGVIGSEGVDAPGTDAELTEAGEGPLGVIRYLCGESVSISLVSRPSFLPQDGCFTMQIFAGLPKKAGINAADAIVTASLEWTDLSPSLSEGTSTPDRLLSHHE